MSDVGNPKPTATPIQDAILFIDDEKNVLAAIHRQLRKDFNILPALNGTEGLNAVAKYKPAVVVCDMRMPDMDGITTLMEIERRSPDTVRIMLTGNADQETAVEAINRGKIFRFLNKPCSEETLRQALNDALRHHELITAERNLLEQTLTGSVRGIVDILSIIAPEAFGRAQRVKGWASAIANAMNLTSRWELELAAILYPIGLVSVPPQVIEKMLQSPQSLSAIERDMIHRTPDVARRLLMHIPRLKGVANIIALQDRGYDGSGYPDRGPVGEAIPIEARILKALKALAEMTLEDVPSDRTVIKFKQHTEAFDPNVVDAIQVVWGIGPAARRSAAGQVRRVDATIDTLLPNDLVLAPIELATGKLLLSEGVRVTAAQIERLRNIRTLEPIKEPIAVERGFSS